MTVVAASRFVAAVGRVRLTIAPVSWSPSERLGCRALALCWRAPDPISRSLPDCLASARRGWSAGMRSVAWSGAGWPQTLNLKLRVNPGQELPVAVIERDADITEILFRHLSPSHELLPPLKGIG